MKENEILKIFEDTQALLKGHFKLSSGLHSDTYFQCALLLQYPDIAEKMCRELAGLFRADKPTLVVAPALGGVVVSYETARALGVRAVFTERVDGKMTLRRNFSITPQDRVLVVEDVITTGLSTKEVIEVMNTAGAKLIGVGSIVDRSGKTLDFGVKLKSLIKLEVCVFQPNDCPLCKKGIGITKPGSRV